MTTKLSKEELLIRLKVLLDFPGICFDNDKEKIYIYCSTLDLDKIAKIVAFLRIRKQKLLKIVNDEKINKEIMLTLKDLKKLKEKYGC